jgi:peroxiredoxin Q/BCP
VVGVSLDDVKSHADFAAKYHVSFPLLSDATSAVATDYGVLATHMGKRYAKRTTFLIDPQGKIAKVYVDVDPEKNSGQVMSDLASLKAAP